RTRQLINQDKGTYGFAFGFSRLSRIGGARDLARWSDAVFPVSPCLSKYRGRDHIQGISQSESVNDSGKDESTGLTVVWLILRGGKEQAIVGEQGENDGF
ncbi:hypothetical protein CIHG_00658, partial [Coccidioides immitis H538.4]